jgi:hypothetical protein
MPKTRCVLWIDPSQSQLFERALVRTDIELVGCGCPDPARTGEVASGLNTTPVDDLRAVMTSSEADLLILGNPSHFAKQAHDPDLDALKAAHARNMSIATLEPIPAAAGEIAGTSFADALTTGSLNELSRLLPLTRHTPLISELETVLETFIPIRSCSITLGVPKQYGSLGARLFDAMDLTRSIMGIPNIIDAGYISPSAGRGLHPLPGQSLRNLHGEFTLNLRFSDGRCASLHLTDQVGSSTLSMTLIGQEGHISVDLDGFRWFNPDGQEIDSYASPKQPEDRADSGQVDYYEQSLIDQLIETCSGVGPNRTPIDYSSVLAMTHATLLSTRTGQGESPRAVEQLMLTM